MMGKNLSFSTLRKANETRLPLFKNAHGKPAHRLSDGSDWSRSDWVEAAMGELGEYCNFSKKFRRGDITEEEFLKHARKELADTVTYLDLLAKQLGIDLGEAVAEKFNEISDRVGCDVKIVDDCVVRSYTFGPATASNQTIPCVAEDRERALYYVNRKRSNEVSVRSGEMFRSANGLNEPWGIGWVGVDAESFTQAQQFGDSILPGAFR